MHGDVGFILLALAVLLFLVSLLQPLIERLAVPATLLLAALGGAIGLLVFVWGEMPRFGLVGDLVVGLGQMGFGADSFLTLFLPPLLFTAGLGIDVRLLREEVGAVLLMAVVAVVVCVFVVGFALAPFGELGPVVALLLGAVIASTDPAAVVGLFRDIGAPRRLTVLVSGESLFNDAASIALFVILVGMVEGAAEPDIWLGVEDFFIAFGGGLVVGYLVARVMCRLFALVSNAPTAAVSLSMAGAYLAYLLAEGYLGSSGVVAVVTAALVVAVEGPTRLSAQAWEALHKAWEQLEYWANSLIFVLASMLAVRVLPDATWADLGLLAVLIAATLLARGLVLYLLLPVMAAVGAAKSVGGKYKAVILWGGLRGAVTLVLALSVVGHERLSDEVRHFVAVLATAFVLFTLFVQGPTLRPLLRLLSLDKLSPLEAALRDRVMALSRQRVQLQTAELAKVYGLSEETVPLASPSPAASSDSGAVPLQAGLLTLVTREKELYIAQFHDQTLSRRLVGQLAAIAERLHDAVKSEGLEGYQRLVGDLVKFAGRLRLALWLQRRWGWSRLLARLLADRFELLLAMERVTRELTDYCQKDLKPLIGAELDAELQVALRQRRALLNDAIGAVEVRYPSYAQALRRQNLFRATLRLERRAYEASLEGSLISREVFNELQRDLSERHEEVERRPDLDLGLRIAEMLGRVSLFTDLPAERLSAIAQQLRPALAYPDEHVVRKGTRGTAMYFIVAGEAVVELPGGDVVLKAGDFFGEMALLTNLPRNADVRAKGFCHLLALEARDFRRVLKMDKALAEKIKEVAASRRQQD